SLISAKQKLNELDRPAWARAPREPARSEVEGYGGAELPSEASIIAELRSAGQVRTPARTHTPRGYGVPYSCRYTLALRRMACTYSRVSVNGIDSTNSCGSRYLPAANQSSTRSEPAL